MTMRLIASVRPCLGDSDQPDLYDNAKQSFDSQQAEDAHFRSLREAGRKRGGAINAAEVRNQRRIAAANRDNARAYSYLIGRAGTEAEAAAIEAEYQRRVEEGPDFKRYRRGSKFMDAPILNIDRNELARMKFTLLAIEKGTWQQRQKGKHGGMLGRMAVQLMETFLFQLYKPGKGILIAIEKLAQAARMSERSVATALDVLETYGFITRHGRLKRIDTSLGPRVVQARNAYELHPPQGFGALAARLFGPRFSATKTAILSDCTSRGVFDNRFKNKQDKKTIDSQKRSETAPTNSVIEALLRMGKARGFIQ